MSPTDERSEDARLRMVETQLRARGLRDERVLDAMASIPRERFLPPGARHMAYDDRAVPLGEGQTVSQPYMVAAMTEALEPGPDDRVLEIGTGSGYQTAVLATLVRAVYSVERFQALADDARARLASLGLDNVRIRVGDGTLGWSEEAPFDAVLVTAGAPSVPGTLLDQLSDEGGRMVVPVGDQGMQTLLRVRRTGYELTRERLMECRFVPLVGAEGWSS